MTPSGPKARARANLAAIRVVRDLTEQHRPATADEQQMLAGWSSWGAIPGIFEAGRDEWAAEHAELRGLLDEREWNQAQRTVINAHYTDPAIVAAMWGALATLGADQGRVLEPGCGSGTFLGMAPDSARMAGVELDPLTAGIAAALYPHAEVRTESFADTRFPAGTFDAAIGNVPFADIRLHDPLHNSNRLSLHNHFIVKSLDLVRPGGVVAVLTSRYTMDASNPAARRDLYDRADLLGAVRLPTGAHRRTAGTDAVTDLLILRRREPDRGAGDDSWLRTTPIRLDGQLHPDVRINRYFEQHPNHVLGEVSLEHGMYNDQTLTVRAVDLDSLPEAFTAAVDRIARTAVAGGLAATPRRDDEASPRLVAEGIQPGLWVGMVIGGAIGGYQIQTNAGLEPLQVKPGHRAELAELIALRDVTRELLDAEAASADDTDILDALRARLRGGYERYVQRHGPINRVTVYETGKPDPETGERPVGRRYPAAIGYLRRDPFVSLVRALEMFDEESQQSSPAAILSGRVVTVRAQRCGADTAEDALAIALDTSGRVELGQIADLLGVEPDTARTMLGELVYDEPGTGRIVPAAEYLSGNVRTKLDAAHAAVDAGDTAYQINVDRLTAVMPEPLGPQDITPKVGATWITVTDHQHFLRQLLQDRNAVVESLDGGVTWGVRALRSGVRATSEWGTDRRPAPLLFQAMLNQQPIIVHDHQQDGPKITNETETEAAKAKAEAIAERFAEWVWEDPERAQRLTDTYNRQFNSLVLRTYDTEGQRLTLPGLVSTWTPRPHQRAAVARMLSEPAVGLFHEVGAGKTGEMVMGAMELKRLGLARKPVIVVPNHMLDQFTRDWQQMYPRARLLAAGADDVSDNKGLGAARRRDLVARIAVGDWDGVIITHGAFERIEVSNDFQVDYLEEQIAGSRAALTAAADDSGERLTVKTLEKRVARQEEAIKAKLDGPRDPGVTFEATGIDYVIVDEAHLFKNLATDSSIQGAGIGGSNRAQDMHMKLELLRSRHGDRVATFATATPIANSITEAHVMTRYLRPDLLQAAGVAAFDQWAATFGETVTQLEPTASGSGYKFKTRFARFQNVPELLRMWSMFADVKTADDLNLPRPQLRARDDGERMPVTHVVPLSDELAAFIDELEERMKLVSGWTTDPDADNILKIIGEGRHAALDMRLVGRDAVAGQTKLTAAADKIAAIWRDNADNQYLDETGQPSPTRGALQLVFSDLSTPKPDRFNVYSELKSLLVERGMPARSIRFIHAADSTAKKAQLFSACRSGDVAVLIGSTSKMGVGTNIQNRAIALHHLDAPWRPADVQQRDGRVWRQYNQNPEVELHRWTTARSFDTFMWQTLARKQNFIEQLLRGRLDVREIDDVGPIRFGYAETTAATAEDPLIIDKANADRDLTKYRRLERAWQNEQRNLDYRIRSLNTAIGECDTNEPVLKRAIDQTRPTGGDQFRLTITSGGAAPVTVTERPKAQAALRDALMARASMLKTYDETPLHVTVDCGGHRFTATQTESMPRTPHFRLTLRDVPGQPAATFTADSLGGGHNVVRMIENTVTGLTDSLNRLRQRRTAVTEERDQATANVGKPFKHAEQLADAEADVQRIDAIFAERAREPEQPDTSSAPAPHQAHPATPVSSSEARATTPFRGRGYFGGSTPTPATPAADSAPVAPAAAQDPPAAASDDSGGTPAAVVNAGPTIRHGASGTTVIGTEKADSLLRQTLRDCGFKWSRNYNMWYLPRQMSEHNRGIRIRRVASVFKFEGRAMLPVMPAETVAQQQQSLEGHASFGAAATDHDLGVTTPGFDL